MQRIHTKIQKFFQHFFTLDDTPHSIALGAALGILLGILPGEGVATTIIIAALLRINKAAATLGVLATNMWGTVATFPVAVFLGSKIFHIDSAILMDNFNQTYHLGFKYFLSKVIFFDLTLPLVVGFFIAAFTISLVFYFLIYFLLKYQKKN